MTEAWLSQSIPIRGFLQTRMDLSFYTAACACDYTKGGLG